MTWFRGIQTALLVIFMALFITFLILYLDSNQNTQSRLTSLLSQGNQKLQTLKKMSVPPEASQGTNSKPSTQERYLPLPELEALASRARSSFSLSRYHYARNKLNKSPFLTIVTRTMPGREDLLKRNVEHCARMVSPDFEHVILTDQGTSGMIVAEAALYAFRDEFQGEYICHLDDDDYLSNYHLVDEIKTAVNRPKRSTPKVIIVRVWHGITNQSLPKNWAQFPCEGEITTSNVIVQAEVYKRNIATVARNHAGDYTFIHNVLLDVTPDEIGWMDEHFFCITRDARHYETKPRDLVTVVMKGGLGNQLFEIATGYAYARKHNKRLVFNHKQTDVGGRNTYFGSLFQWTENCPDIDQLHFNEYREPGLHFSPIPYIHSHVRLDGYFQSDKYFADYRDEFLKHFSSFYVPSLAPIDTRPLVISMHIRRTDYVGHPLYAVPGLGYYQRAVDLVRSRLPGQDIVIKVFSDDLPWCREQLPGAFSTPMQFAQDTTSERPEITELFWMSECDHHILANSSFSWWGAWLDPKPNSLVVLPKDWYTDLSIKWSDIYCDDWIVI